MDVDKVSFPGRLLEILEAISDSLFVSFDLELSGVPSKSAGSRSKQTIQGRYEEIKEAAERYQILQVGLTCVQLDKERDVYIVRPYNFHLSPLLEEKLELERIFSFQSCAVEFLLSHGFDISLPFKAGVPYLSRDEAKLAKKIAMNRLDKSSYEDIQLEVDHVESLEFVKRVRETVDIWVGKWKASGKNPSAFLNICSIDPTKESQPTVPELGRFEKRLVHQLIRAEYPELVTISRMNGIRIVPYDEAREKNVRATRKRKVKEQIAKQTGFRWIVEALCGGDLDKIDVSSFSRNPYTGEQIFLDTEELNARFGRAKEHLRAHRPVLVGHNLFTDLVYFYRTFIGPLPDKVSDFQSLLHDMFPVIVDTKYMATHNCGDISPASSLDQIEEQLRMQSRPWIDMHPWHGKYMSAPASLHEAGFDSYLTALIMIRLSAKLASTKKYLDDPANLGGEDDYDTALEDQPVDVETPEIQILTPETTPSTSPSVSQLNGFAAPFEPKGLFLKIPASPIKAAPTLLSPIEIPVTNTSGQFVFASPDDDVAPKIDQGEPCSPSKKKRKRNKKKKTAAAAAAAAAAAVAAASVTPNSLYPPHNGLFAHLSEVPMFPDIASSPSRQSSPMRGQKSRQHSPIRGRQAAVLSPGRSPCSFTGSWDMVFDADSPTGLYSPQFQMMQQRYDASLDGPDSTKMAFMPPFASSFWRVYGNKLRIFGTVEGVCKLE